jgi:GDP-L-fucose synthase
VYGPGDNYHPENSHVVPALIRRFHEAKEKKLNEVVVWGSGSPMREFLYVDDMAEASIFVHNLERDIYERTTQPLLSHINVGTGLDVTVRELAETVREIVGFSGKLVFDTTKPDGTPRKLMDVKKLERLGYAATTSLHSGIKLAYEDFLINGSELRI